MAESAGQEYGKDGLQTGVRSALVDVTEEEIMFRKRGPRREAATPSRAEEPSERAEMPSREASRWPWDPTSECDGDEGRRRGDNEYTLWGLGGEPARRGGRRRGTGAPEEDEEHRVDRHAGASRGTKERQTRTGGEEAGGPVTNETAVEGEVAESVYYYC